MPLKKQHLFTGSKPAFGCLGNNVGPAVMRQVTRSQRIPDSGCDAVAAQPTQEVLERVRGNLFQKVSPDTP